ncbi:MAG: hypothetical protein ACE14T_07255 [Syntrophales bacterium]
MADKVRPVTAKDRRGLRQAQNDKELRRKRLGTFPEIFLMLGCDGTKAAT